MRKTKVMLDRCREGLIRLAAAALEKDLLLAHLHPIRATIWEVEQAFYFMAITLGEITLRQKVA